MLSLLGALCVSISVCADILSNCSLFTEGAEVVKVEIWDKGGILDVNRFHVPQRKRVLSLAEGEKILKTILLKFMNDNPISLMRRIAQKGKEDAIILKRTKRNQMKVEE